MPQRIQMSRQRPWRAEHPDAVIVDRRTKWGNPYRWQDVRPGEHGIRTADGHLLVYVTMSPETAKEIVVELFGTALRGEDRPESFDGYPSVEEIRAELAGKDLACWCDLDTPCHADVLLEIANSPEVS